MVEVHLPNFNIKAIADSGQCFRLDEVEKGRHLLIAGDKLLYITELVEGGYLFHCNEDAYDRVWKPYFDLETNYAQYAAGVPAEDAFLQAAVTFGEGLRILRQDPWETLITFIISQQKNIPAIKKAVALISERYGKQLGEAIYGFPTWAALAEAGEDGLRQCGLGYRCGYIHAAARMVDNGLLNLQGLRQADDMALQQALLAVPGVGIKVANCVMLFGYHRIDAFPRDVWINRIIDKVYGGVFPVERYAGYAGVIQQYMFYYGRKHWSP